MTGQDYISGANFYFFMVHEDLLLGLRNQDRLQEDHRRVDLHAHPTRSSYRTPRSHSSRIPLRNHRAGSSPSEAQSPLGNSQPNIQNYSQQESLASLAALTYGLAGNHHVLRCRGLHRLLLLRWVDFRHFVRWDGNANSSCELLLNDFVKSNLVESLLNPISRKSNITSDSFLILPSVCSVLRVL